MYKINKLDNTSNTVLFYPRNKHTSNNISLDSKINIFTTTHVFNNLKTLSSIVYIIEPKEAHGDTTSTLHQKAIFQNLKIVSCLCTNTYNATI